MLKKTKLLVQLSVDVKEYNFDPGHNCWKCEYLLNEMSCQAFYNLSDIETKISKDIKMSLLYILGHVTRKNCSTEEEIFDNTSFYLKELNFF